MIRPAVRVVKSGKAQCEHMFSALPPKADISQLRALSNRDSDYSGCAGYIRITEVTRITGIAKGLGWLRLSRGRCSVIADSGLRNVTT
jgi:hypothetical protein